MERLMREYWVGEKLISASRKHVFEDCVAHFHDFYEIEYIIQGNGSCVINGMEETCGPGMLCFLTPLDYHSVQSDGMELYNVMFSEQLVDFHLLEPFLRYSAPKTVIVEPPMRPFVEQLFAETVCCDKQGEYASTLMHCLLLKLVQIFPAMPDSGARSVMTEIHGYMINHYRQQITLDAVAGFVGLTPSYVSACFKKEMKIGFKRYLNGLRLEYAKKLLINTDKSIRQICEESGFEDFPNFIKQFKRYHGMTPTHLRKSWKTEAE